MTARNDPPDPDRPARPPAADPAVPHLRVDPSVVPRGGGDVTLVLVNPTAEEVHFGVLGQVRRWVGGTWVDHRQLLTGLHDHPGRLIVPGEDVAVPLVAFFAPPGGLGPPVRVHLEGLEEGHYRFVLGPAAGIVVVGEIPG